MQDAGVDLAGPVLAGRGMGQAQQVEVGAVVARIADLAAGQKGLQRQRPAERHHRIRVGCRGQAVVHDLGDETRHAEQIVGQRAGILRGFGGSGS